MEASKDFKAFYRTDLLPVFNILEKDRKKFINTIFLAVVGLIIVLILSITISITSDEPETSPVIQNDNSLNQNNGPLPANNTNGSGVSGVFLLVIIIGIAGHYFWLTPKKKSIKLRFKKELIDKLVKYVDAGLSYRPELGISRSEFSQSYIFLSTGDRYSSEDLVSGTIGNTAIQFSEVHSEKEDADEDISKKNSAMVGTYTTLFKGFMFIADFNKNFSGRTVVLTDQAEKAFGGFGTMLQKMNKKRDPLIKLDNVEFEKAFAVYGTDPVETNYILSPALMERILAFKRKAGKIELSFINSRLYVTIPKSENFFEANIYSQITSYSKLETYYYNLQLITGIVEDLNLNNRIWTKE